MSREHYRPTSKKLDSLNSGHAVRIEIRDGKRGWKYVLRFTNPLTGKTTHLSTRSQDLDVVQIIRRKKEEEVFGIRHGIPLVESNSPKFFHELVESYMEYLHNHDSASGTIAIYDTVLNRFAMQVGSIPIGEIKRQHIEDYIARERRKKRVATGINKDLRHLRAVFNHAEENEWIEKSPMRVRGIMLPEPKREPRILAPKDIQKILGRCRDDIDRDMVLFVYLTGLRVGAVLQLKWADIGDGFVHVTTKRGQQYNVPISSAAQEVLNRQPKHEGIEWVWARRGRGGVGFQNRPWTTEGVNHRFREAFEGYKGQFHTLRHNFASQAVSKGYLPAEAVQDLLGHSQASTTRGYIHLMTSDAQERLDKFGQDMAKAIEDEK